MKKQRKTLSLLLAMVLVLGLFPAPFPQNANVYAAETAEAPTEPAHGTIPDTDISWEVTPDEGAEWDLENGQPFKLTLKGSGDMPEYQPGDTSKKEKFPYLDYRAYITSVEIGEGITSIGSYAFFRYYPSLKSITVPDSVTKIGKFAFKESALLEEVTCGAGLKTIGENAFGECKSLKTVHLNEGLEEIGKSAFSGDKVLTSIELPDSLLTIGEGAFSSVGIKVLTIPVNLESIAEGAFYQVKLNLINVKEGNTHFKVDKYLLYTLTEEGTPDVALLYPSGYNVITDIKILEGTTRIAKYAFYTSIAPRSVTLPDTIR